MKSAKPKPKAPRRGAGYLRESVAQKGERVDVSFIRQKTGILERAAMMGVPMGPFFTDHNISGRTPGLLVGLSAALAAARRLEFDHLLVEKVDRLGRNAFEVKLVWGKFDRAGVAVYDSHGTRITEQLVTVLALAAELNSTDNGARMRASRREKASAGRGYGVEIFGYHLDANDRYVVYEAEAVQVRFALALYADGALVAAIVKEMRALGWTRSDGTPWLANQLFRKRKVGDELIFEGLLTRTCYGGMRTFGETRYTAHTTGYKRERSPEAPILVPITPLVDARTYERVRARLASLSTAARDPNEYLLEGLLACGECGRTLRTSNGQTLACRPWNRTVALVCTGLEAGDCSNDLQAEMGSTLIGVCHALAELMEPLHGEDAYRQAFSDTLDEEERAAGVLPANDVLATIEAQTAVVRDLTKRRGQGEAGVTLADVLAADAEIQRLMGLLERKQADDVERPSLPAADTVESALLSFMLRMPRSIAAADSDDERIGYVALRSMIRSVAVLPTSTFGQYRLTVRSVIGVWSGISWVRFIPLGGRSTALLDALKASGRLGLSVEDLKQEAVRHGSPRNEMRRSLQRLLDLGYARRVGQRFAATGRGPIELSGKPLIVVMRRDQASND